MKNPWGWIPTLYFAEGLPYAIVMSASVAMYKLLGVSNADIAFYTSWLYLPWVIKPLWSPIVDIFKQKRWWILTMQLVLGCMLACVGLTLQVPDFFRYSLIFFFLMAFSSATHDIAADGFYMIALREDQQSFFVGIRSTFYRLGVIAGQGLIVVLAGFLARNAVLGNMQLAWSVTFLVFGGLFVLMMIYHNFILPRPVADKTISEGKSVWRELADLFVSFVTKKGIIAALAFMLFYRLAESQLVKIAGPFLLDERAVGGLGLSAESYGVIYGTIGVVALLIGGILGGIAVSRKGLKKCIWYMVAAMNIPNILYLYLAYFQPESIVVISGCVALEQLGYGFGFTAYMLYLIMFSDGEHKTSHYALCTGFMALGMMLPGMFSGKIQELLGYTSFFVWVLICTIPSFIAVKFLKIPRNFGIKQKEN